MVVKRVLCPTDFSEASAHALDQAVAVAGWYDAHIIALHVNDPMVPSAVAAEASPAFRQSLEAELKSEVATHSRVATAAGVSFDVVIESGDAARHILERARRLPADLIVMGTHGASGFQHLVLGSVTEKVLRKSPCPVLTVPPRAHATARLPFRHVVCAIDFSDSSLAALDYGVSLARESEGALTILHVLEWPWHEPPPPTFSDLPPAQAAALAEYRRYCEQGAEARLRSLVPTGDSAPTKTRIMHGKPYVETLRVAEEERADVIVLGVHGRNALELAVFGSTANQLVRRATCPVLTVRR